LIMTMQAAAAALTRAVIAVNPNNVVAQAL
jgi:hypothetical protein